MKCDFTLYTVASWKDGTPQAEVKPAKLSFRFEQVDTDGGTASVVGPFGRIRSLYGSRWTRCTSCSRSATGLFTSRPSSPDWPALAAGWRAYPARIHRRLVAGLHLTARAVLRVMLAGTVGADVAWVLGCYVLRASCQVWHG